MASDEANHDKENESASASASCYAAIILAGGTSQRMGNTNKLLMDFDGYSLLKRAATAATTAGVEEVVVVLGHESEKARKHLENLNVLIVVNSQYEQGQMSSVQSGFAALKGDKKAVIICLADQPLIGAAQIRLLVSEFNNQSSDKEILVPTYQGQRGNPVIVSESVRKQVLEGGQHPGCRRFIDANPKLVNWLMVDDAAFTSDIDTPEDYRALLDGQKK